MSKVTQVPLETPNTLVYLCHLQFEVKPSALLLSILFTKQTNLNLMVRSSALRHIIPLVVVMATKWVSTAYVTLRYKWLI